MQRPWIGNVEVSTKQRKKERLCKISKSEYKRLQRKNEWKEKKQTKNEFNKKNEKASESMQKGRLGKKRNLYKKTKQIMKSIAKMKKK